MNTISKSRILAWLDKPDIPLDLPPLLGRTIRPYELQPLSKICLYSKAKRIFEFGTSMGATSYALARLMPKSKIYTLDINDKWKKQDVEFPGNIKFLKGNTFEFDFGKYANKMDVVFIDACHAFEAAKNDTLHAIGIMRPGGIIVWHDYLRPPKTSEKTQVREAVASVGLNAYRIKRTRLAFWTDRAG